MYHGHRRACGGGDHVDLPVHAQRVIGDDHGKVGGTGGYVARALPHGVGGNHAGAGVALAGGHGDAGLQVALGIQEPRARLGQHAAPVARAQHLGQNIPQLPGHTAHGVEDIHHPLVKVQLFGVDGEHAGGLADAHHLFAGELEMNVTRQSGEEGNVLYMAFLVQNGLVQVGDAPALGNVEIQRVAELGRRLAGDGVAPGAEGRQLVAVLVKGQVTMHHGGNADGPHLGKGDAQLLLHIPLQVGVAVLNAVRHSLHGIGPDAVHQLIFPLVGAGGNGNMVFVDQHRFDPGGTKLDAQRGIFQIHDRSPSS